MLFLKQGSHMRRTILIAVLIIVACIFCFLFPIFHSSAAPNYRKSIIPNEFIIYVGSEDSQTEYTVESGGVVSVMVNEEPLVIILPYELDRKSTRLNSQSPVPISYAVFCLKKKR